RPAPPAPPFAPLDTKPKSQADIERFRAQILDRKLSLEKLATEYGTTVRTISRWCEEFEVRRAGRGVKVNPSKIFSAKARVMVADAKEAVGSLTKAMSGQKPADEAEVDGVPVRSQLDPMADPKVRELMAEIEGMALTGRSMSDLHRLQQTLGRLLTVVMARAPIRSWNELGEVAASFYKMILYSRRVEAEMPPNQDPVALRQEAGRQLMQELGGVLTPEEQDQMGRLMQAAAGRLQARRGLPAPLAPEPAKAEVPMPPALDPRDDARSAVAAARSEDRPW
ncbi:MAG TPA: hypothetical protein VJU18_14110, partial [Vicinamibacteria bacterium]|nr:hypothetical protein [Vicinamibacteria bacterium]